MAGEKSTGDELGPGGGVIGPRSLALVTLGFLAGGWNWLEFDLFTGWGSSFNSSSSVASPPPDKLTRMIE